VRPGDTLGGIAARYGTSVSALAALNGIRDPGLVVAGRVLHIPAGPASAPSTGSAGVAQLIAQHSARHGVDPALARAIAWQESRWIQSARSSVGAIGVMQLMPDTARWFGPAVLGRRIDPRRIEDNIEGGVAYLAWLRRQAGSTRTAIMAYYQGLTSLRHRGPYDDTKDYLASVNAFYGRV
jgi:soluble lytic murein transglycosylase-like protein